MNIPIQILPRSDGGTEYLPRPHRLHLGAQQAQGVDTLCFSLPPDWAAGPWRCTSATKTAP